MNSSIHASIYKNKSWVVTYIDDTTAFESISHKFMDTDCRTHNLPSDLQSSDRYCVSTWHWWQIWICRNFQCMQRRYTRWHHLTSVFYTSTGPVNTNDGQERIGDDVKCDKILKIRVIDYTDDVALAEHIVEDMTTWITDLSDVSKREADMDIHMNKTVSQNVHKRESIAVTAEGIATTEVKYEHKCDFCLCKFKTDRSIHMHTPRKLVCAQLHNDRYGLHCCKDWGVFGHKDTRFFLLKWEGYEEPECETEHLLKCDKLHDMIRSFWSTFDFWPTHDFYAGTPPFNHPLHPKTWKPIF